MSLSIQEANKSTPTKLSRKVRKRDASMFIFTKNILCQLYFQPASLHNPDYYYTAPPLLPTHQIGW